MTSPTSALTVTQLSRLFNVSAPWLNRVVERKPKAYLRAVDDISFSVPSGGCLSLVGESGCGKSTVARLVTGLYSPTAGEMHVCPWQEWQAFGSADDFPRSLCQPQSALAGV